MTTARTVIVVQARMGSSRLPGKILAPIGDRPLIDWVIGALTSLPPASPLVVATTDEPSDDALEAALAGRVAVHRGSTDDVLGRCWDAVRPYDPEIVVRATADNPFVDPDVVAAQVAHLAATGDDYVGNAGWPLGIAAEVVTARALGEAAAEATDPAEREHVLPFIYTRPSRYRIGRLDPPPTAAHPRYTVDTDEDLAFARAVAAAVGHGPPVHYPELDALLTARPDLGALNRDVPQRPWSGSAPR